MVFFWGVGDGLAPLNAPPQKNAASMPPPPQKNVPQNMQYFELQVPPPQNESLSKSPLNTPSMLPLQKEHHVGTCIGTDSGVVFVYCPTEIIEMYWYIFRSVFILPSSRSRRPVQIQVQVCCFYHLPGFIDKCTYRSM